MPHSVAQIKAAVETAICARDGRTGYRTIAINPLAHKWGGWMRTKAPTETEEGEETRICALDPSHTETRSIPKLTAFTSIHDLES
jgi:hypothetical protein